MNKKNIFIAGAGAVGLAVGCEIQKIPGARVYIVERNMKVRGDNQSSRNSGVIHAGIYYPKSKCPLKAKLCVEGNRLLYDFCMNHNVPYKKTGKLVIASCSMATEYLEETFRTASENDVPGVVWIDGRDIGRYEPGVKGVNALLVPTSGIVDASALVSALHAIFKGLGGTVITGARLVSVEHEKTSESSRFRLGLDFGGGAGMGKKLENIEYAEADYVINSAGLFSDEVARMINPESTYEIEPVRGEAAKFYSYSRPELFMTGMNVYPAPYGYWNSTGEKAMVPLGEFHKLLAEGKITKTVGIHLTPVFDYSVNRIEAGRTITIGPAKTVGRDKDDYGTGLRPVSDYLKAVKGFFPNLEASDIELHQAGIMAVPKGHSDFIIEHDRNHERFINLIGIDSPGITSCIAVGKYVRSMLMEAMK